MSQKASTHLLLREPSFDLIANEPWSIDTYADGLMDELFADIDLILDGSGNLPNQTVSYGSRLKSGDSRPVALNEETRPTHWLPTALPSEYIDLQTVRVPQIVLPETVRQRPVKTVPKVRNNQLSTFVVGTPGVRNPRHGLRRTLGKLLWVGASLGLAIPAIIWVLHSGLLNRLVSNSLHQSLRSPQLQSPLPTRGEVEADLVNYMLGALAVLDKQEAKSNLQSASRLLTASARTKQTALAYVTNRTGNLPPPVAANNTPPAQSRSTTLVERIYIPVYQPSPMRYAPPQIAGALSPLPPSIRTRVGNAGRTPTPVASVGKPANGLLSSGNRPTALPTSASMYRGSLVKSALNTVQKPAKPVTVTALAAVRPDIKPVALQAAPVTVRQPPKPLPVLPVTPSRVVPPKLPTATAPAPSRPTPEPPPAPEEVASVVSPPSVASFSHTLEGLLELGDKSAALFKIEGVTRRVDMGETIGSSGWTLVDIANGEAIIRRNGEVRSIYAGQKF